MIEYRKILEIDNETIRSLYREINIEMGTSLVFMNGVLDNELKNPFEYYSQHNRKMWVATTQQNEIVAMMAVVPLDDGRYEIEKLLVKKEYRRLGIGTTLINLAKNDGEITLSCFYTNEDGIKFYKTCMNSCEKKDYVSKRTGESYSLYHFSSK